jgi:hypothetical protein
MENGERSTMELGENMSPIQDYKERIRLFEPVASMLTKGPPIQDCKIRTVAFSLNIGDIGDKRRFYNITKKYFFSLLLYHYYVWNCLYRLYKNVRYTYLYKTSDAVTRFFELNREKTAVFRKNSYLIDFIKKQAKNKEVI